MAGTDEISGSWGDWAQDRAFRTALWAARRLPYERRIPAFGALARRVLVPATDFGRRIAENLDYIWPEMPAERRREIAAQSADNTGRAMAEHYSMPELLDRMELVTPRGAGYAQMRAAREAGRPVILVTAHFGNYEALCACLIRRGMPVGAFYRPMANPYIDANYMQAVDGLGSGPLFSQDRAGMGQMLRYLKSGGGVAMLNDLYVGSGIEMDFLGKPAMTGLAVAELALRLDAPLFPGYGIRRPDGLTFDAEIEAAIPPGDAVSMTAALNQSLERRIAADPGQWFWMHRRWKRKWNRGKGMEPGLHPAALPRRKSG